MYDQPEPHTERVEDWCEELVATIGRRASLTYTINEILKTNTKTVFTEAALTYLKAEQIKANQTIKAVLAMLISGHK